MSEVLSTAERNRRAREICEKLWLFAHFVTVLRATLLVHLKDPEERPVPEVHANL